MPKKAPHGIINQTALGRKNDYLYRISLKALIRNESGDVLVVKEAGRTWWDLPGGGMDHNEDVTSAIARELQEEVGLRGKFSYRVIDVDNPAFLSHANVWQLRLIFEVLPQNMHFRPGEDADELMFLSPDTLKESENPVERKIYEYTAKL